MSKAMATIEKVRPGLYHYAELMSMLHKVDVSKDLAFQRKFNGYYRVRQRKPEFYKEYYEYLERNKNGEVTYLDTISHFYGLFNRIEASFCSKLVATINPHMPVWDSYVLANLGLKKPVYSTRNRLEKTIDLYANIVNWYEEFLQTDDAKRLIEMFDARFKEANITDVKKIDLILWQMR